MRVPASPSGNAYDVYVIGYLPQAVTNIRRGENAGRTLKEVNVVRSIRRLGASGEAAHSWKVPLRTFPNDASRALVMLQAKGNGPIASAVSVKLR